MTVIKAFHFCIRLVASCWFDASLLGFFLPWSRFSCVVSARLERVQFLIFSLLLALWVKGTYHDRFCEYDISPYGP
jgi:hypothetical protein